MITCQTAKEYISLNLDDELDHDDHKLLNEHLLRCTECREYQESINNLHTLLTGLPDVTPPISIVDQLIQNGDINPDIVDQTKEDNEKGTGKPIKRRIKPWHMAAIAASLLIGMWIPLSNMMSVQYNEEMAQNVADENTAQESKVDKNSSMKVKGPDFDKALGVQSTHNENLNTEYSLTADTVKEEIEGNDSVASSPEAPNVPFSVKEKNNQLVVYNQQEEQLFVSRQWDNNLTVKWHIVDETQIIYSLFNYTGEEVATYQIIVNKKADHQFSFDEKKIEKN